MCEWSLRVSDHFQVPRQTVAVSFNLLDRFVEKCQCDRSAFKLAAMTTLYMASKICGSAHKITIQSLAELSRGEFDRSHIQEMETIILQTLGWRLNPPTAQCFIDNFYYYLPVKQGLVSAAIYQRATFFVELALYDYAFVSKKRALLALAAMVNAMEGLNESAVSSQQQDSFAQVICMAFGLKFTHEEIEAVRNRLWYVYSMSAQYKDDDAISSDDVKRDSELKHKDADAMQIEPSCPSSSPVSVAGPLS
jgi:transcription initiation factor TFIIIB Brf1 subunit/transcription initiation factor TFIIB